MPTPKKASTKKTTKAAPKKASARAFSVNIQLPGQPAEKRNIKPGTTVGDLIEDMNLDGYVVRVNAKAVADSVELVKGDNIRIGVKTKQG